MITSDKEDLVDFLECDTDTGVTGTVLAEKITTSITRYGLDMHNLRGQAYDGAGNMAGKSKGAAAIIQKANPLALYQHCSSHALNLAVVKSIQNTSIRNMMGAIERTSTFMEGHPKRGYAFEKAVLETQPESRKHKLKNLCRTRWVQRLDGLETFVELHPSIVACMEDIVESGAANWSTDSLTDAKGLLLAITSTDFIMSLVITNSALCYLKGLTTSLQAEAKDIVEASNEISCVKESLQDVRNNIDDHYSQWFRQAEQMCEVVGVTPSMPRLCKRQRNRDNTPAENPAEYNRRIVAIPILDHLIAELNMRFSSLHQKAMQGLSLIPSILVNLTPAEGKKTLLEAVNLYQDDLPSIGSIKSEVHNWMVKWEKNTKDQGHTSLPSTLGTPLSQTSSSMFPNFRTLLTILCTLPVTSCSVERSFSGLKRIKTPCRSTMGNERLTGLTLLHMHRDIHVDISKVIDIFAQRNPRRMKLANVLVDANTCDYIYNRLLVTSAFAKRTDSAVNIYFAISVVLCDHHRNC